MQIDDKTLATAKVKANETGDTCYVFKSGELWFFSTSEPTEGLVIIVRPDTFDVWWAGLLSGVSSYGDEGWLPDVLDNLIFVSRQINKDGKMMVIAVTKNLAAVAKTLIRLGAESEKLTPNPPNPNLMVLHVMHSIINYGLDGYTGHLDRALCAVIEIAKILHRKVTTDANPTQKGDY